MVRVLILVRMIVVVVQPRLISAPVVWPMHP